MPNIFISFDHDDQKQVGGFKLLKNNPKYPLDFRDHSLKQPVTSPGGKPLVYPPSDPRSEPVRKEIISKFEKSLKLVVLIGDLTYNSEWVKWEVDTFFDMKYKLSGDKTWKRIRGMRLKGSENARISGCLYDRSNKSTQVMNWDPEGLDKWLDIDPDK